VVLTNGNLQVDFMIETKAADGKVVRNQSRLIARSGMQCGITVGNVMLDITPKLKAE
jgi:hypothetical protein